jgi:YggT family protein
MSVRSAILLPRPEWTHMLELLGFISYLITLYVYIIIAGAVMSWLIAFNVINPYNQFVRALWQGLNALTEPALRPIRRVLPDLGGIDISPLVLILICFFIQSVVLTNLAKLFV